MTTNKTLRDVRVGDTICVVWQVSDRSKRPPVIEERVIEKVGNKYLYFTKGGWNVIKIDRDTGMSVHQDGCVRANGRGCDAYACEADYIHEQTAKQQVEDLEKRLISRSYNCGINKDLPHEAVMKIHAVLDEAGWDMPVRAQ